jgi:hypothetical protein
MNRDSRNFGDFPKTVSAGTSSPQRQYQRVDTHFAVHGQEKRSEVEPTLEFGPERIAVYPIDRFRDVAHSGSETTPVYSLTKNGTVAVPTGKVFVRLAQNLNFEDSAEAFRRAGYEVDQTLSYAPNAGWLRPTSSSVASSLAGLSKLSAIPGVDNVEPQMLSKRASKL